MKSYYPAAITILLCTVAQPAISGVPSGVQRTNESQYARTSIAQASTTKPSANDECTRMEALEKEIASLRSRVDDMLARLRIGSADGK